MKRTGKTRNERRHSRDAKWGWLANYRVWDADRKVFLYPENWIEPDLAPRQACLASLRKVLAAVRAPSGARAKRQRDAKASRARGVRVWLTGKNRARARVTAQVLASDLGRDLYHVDLGLVASRYVGRTENHLRRVFDAAEKGGAVLLFDEADALLGRRSGVKDSHDRYANAELDYLLQRMERYRGLAVLTTGSRRAIDKAFSGRFDFVVRVPPCRRRGSPKHGGDA